MIEVTIKEDPEKPRKKAQNTPFPNGKTLKKETFRNYLVKEPPEARA